MYPWYSMEIPTDSRLPLDDRIAIQHLYGPNQNDLQSFPGGENYFDMYALMEKVLKRSFYTITISNRFENNVRTTGNMSYLKMYFQNDSFY